MLPCVRAGPGLRRGERRSAAPRREHEPSADRARRAGRQPEPAGRLTARPVPYRFVALALIMGVQTATNLGILGLPSLAPMMRADLGLSRQEAGSFISAFYVGGVL